MMDFSVPNQPKLNAGDARRISSLYREFARRNKHDDQILGLRIIEMVIISEM